MSENCELFEECAILDVCKAVVCLVPHGFRNLDWLVLHGNPMHGDTPVALKWLGGHPCWLGKILVELY